jgi:hypothetical protein
VFNNNAADTLDLWMDPVIGATLGSPNDSYSGARMTLNKIDIRYGYQEGGSLVDEIRIGETMADVLPAVPIPAAFWLLVSGLIALVGFRKNFRKK